MPDASMIQASLRTFLSEEVLAPGALIDEHADLAELGVDSFALMEVLLHVERAWGVSVPMEHLTPENTRTVSALADCVAGVVRVARVA